MRKPKFRLLFLLLFTYIFLTTKITFAEDTIDIPNEYFTNNNINNGNKSNVILNDKGTNGFGLFFLGDENTDSSSTYTLSLQGGSTINCNKKLKGYYTNNFLNFKIFPLDESTNLTNGVTLVDGGLFYECRRNNTIYNGVYGYVKWRYKSGTDTIENTHEIRAGINSQGQRIQNSPLKLQYDNNGNYRALSGQFQDYLAKNAIVHSDFNEGVYIYYPDIYFTGTKTFSGNRNEIQFDDSGNDGFGLFFLGTGLENGPYTITTGNTTLTCTSQINGYYSFSSNDFGMLPLDADTNDDYNQHPNYIKLLTGGLYYNCKKGNTIYTGVYGYLKRNYNSGNIHEIRAGIDSNGNFINKSPIEIIYSDNFRNVNRTLSGQFHDNLSKNSEANARFFGDIGILSGNEEIKATGSIEDPYIIIPYEYYRNAKIYVKSSKINTNADLYMTAFDNNGQQRNLTYDLGTLNSQRPDFGFYAYKETSNDIFANIFSNDLRSGTITTVLYNGNETWSQSIRFVITGSSENPDITVEFSGTNCSKTGVTITATSSGSIKYAIVDGDSCGPTSSYSFITYPSDGIYLTQEHIGKYVCFITTYNGNTGYNSWQVTGIDIYGPTFELHDWEGFECETGELKIENLNGSGCSSYTNAFYWNGSLSNSNIFTLFSGGVGNIIVTGQVKDDLGNITTHTGQILRQNSDPELDTYTLEYRGTVVLKNTTLYTNLINEMGAKDGKCGNSTITKTGDITCTIGTGAWTGDSGIMVSPADNTAGEISCTVKFADDEGNIVTGTVTYYTNTILPEIQITGPDPINCSTGKTISATSSGTMQKCMGNIGDNNVCEWCEQNNLWEEYTKGTTITFNNENDNGKYICFKATDSGKVAYAKTGINNIDTTPPTIHHESFWGEDDVDIRECSTINLNINGNDNGCGGGKMELKIGGQIISTERNGDTYQYPTIIGDSTGTIEINVTITDKAGNTTSFTETYHPDDIMLTGTGFSKTLERSEDGSLVAAGNWKELTNAQAGECELIRMVTEPVCSEGERISQDNYKFIYTHQTNATSGYCDFTITDGESRIPIRANFYDCTQEGINECKPQLTPIFTGCVPRARSVDCSDSQYITYEIDNRGKYTSGSRARIQINGTGLSTLSKFRFTCVEQGRYCEKLEDWSYINYIYNINTNLTQLTNGLNTEICTIGYHTENARSERKPYPDRYPDVFEIILDGHEGACDTAYTTPYGSIDQGTRKVRIEVEDINGYKAIEATTDNIIYTTTPPKIEFYREGVMNRNMLGETTQRNGTMTVNSGNFTVYVEVKGADLPNGMSGQNYNYEYQLQSLGGLLWFDNITRKDWLITHYGNNY